MLLGNRLRSQNAATCEHSMKNVENEARIDKQVGSRELQKKALPLERLVMRSGACVVIMHITRLSTDRGCVFFGIRPH